MVTLPPDDQAAEGTDGESDGTWPSVAFEEYPWSPNEAVPRSQLRKLAASYQAAVPPPIAGVSRVPLPAEVDALAADASAEIARFDTQVGSDLAPFAAILLRSESAASSRIENLTASAKAIALAELGDPSRRNASVIVANTRAMEAAIDLSDRLDEDAIIAMHTALLGASRPELIGHWRYQQVWIGGSNYGPFGARFVPPHHCRVPAAMADLRRFVERDDLPVLVQAVVAHAQFETIHPFPDGNGRTGRALIHALLRAKGLTRKVTVPVSAGLLNDTEGYFDALDAYRRGDPSILVQHLADASFAAINNGRHLVADLHALRSGWNDLVQVRAGATVWRLADLLLRQPVIDSALVQRELEVGAMTANRAIDSLATYEVLTKVSGNRRDRKWSSPDVLAVLDAFAERSGRRG